MDKLFLFILILVTGIETTEGQVRYISGKLSDDASVSILTVGPAEPAYTMFGHTAIRLQDPAHNIDRVYNYGTFDFDSANFYFKFLYGDLRYWLSESSFETFRRSNIALGRSIVSQKLNLSPSEVSKLVRRLKQNNLPENSSYQYQFFRRNCVTQVRDLLEDQAIWSSREQQSTAKTLSADTYRKQLDTYISHRPWTKLAINLMLGSLADQPVTDWEKNYLPNTLHYTLANSFDASGEPVVASTKTIAKASIQKKQTFCPPIFVLWIVFLAVSAFTSVSLILDWSGGWLDQLLFGTVGLVGLFIAFGSLISLHQPMHFNWNLLWVLPTHLGIAIAIPWLSPKLVKAYFMVTLMLGITVIIGWTFIPQQIPTAVIPVIAVLLLRSIYRCYMADRSEYLKWINQTI